ncbi:arylformamidase [Alicyclobacillus sp. ALC3]|uniref:arylformamidase n=1 Tax=Alicyclobacillus sp. ALC3 TaxID=2796143 RepID=UPI00237932CF|nr:arylformamidase [Alicyclobacillus sp. ALC3]WDL95977.1 arylformamidase [Alicyclobacillus sp. ALC3]
MSKEWIDVSQRLTRGVATWPGDTPFSYELAWTKADSGSVNVGRVTMSIHTGTHVDAPFHFDDAGLRAADLDLTAFIGPARVVHLPLGEDGVLGPDALSAFDLTGVTRLLVRTDAWRDRAKFPEHIPPLHPALGPFLAALGVRLFGVDLPSVDVLDSKPLPTHHALTEEGIAIVEGLVLDDVAPGDYEFIALPLALADADGSPVRAVLRPL